MSNVYIDISQERVDQTKTILIDGLHRRTSLYKFRSVNLTNSLFTNVLVIVSVEGRGVLQRVPMLLF